jgi:hypothetical protein
MAAAMAALLVAQLIFLAIRAGTAVAAVGLVDIQALVAVVAPQPERLLVPVHLEQAAVAAVGLVALTPLALGMGKEAVEVGLVY